ncbi:MAG: hypothetical protein M3Q70_01090 [bacterium]|nr:hypothetical protein [bacterium]
MYITETNDTLSVILEGGEQIAALKARVRIPKRAIQKISYAERFNDWRNWEVRMPGTYAPKLLMAGSYWTEEGWDFVYAKKPKGFVKPVVEDVLVIETDINRFRRVIITCSKERTDELLAWWKRP